MKCQVCRREAIFFPLCKACHPPELFTVPAMLKCAVSELSARFNVPTPSVTVSVAIGGTDDKVSATGTIAFANHDRSCTVTGEDIEGALTKLLERWHP